MCNFRIETKNKFVSFLNAWLKTFLSQTMMIRKHKHNWIGQITIKIRHPSIYRPFLNISRIGLDLRSVRKIWEGSEGFRNFHPFLSRKRSLKLEFLQDKKHPSKSTTNWLGPHKAKVLWWSALSIEMNLLREFLLLL